VTSVILGLMFVEEEAELKNKGKPQWKKWDLQVR